MLKYCLKKIGQLAIVMLLISFFSFAIIDLAPGDISSMYLTPDMTEAERQLITDPKLLIADEPTTSLDVTIQAQILELMKQLQQKLGMAIIMITHDLGVVADMADDIIVMYAGKIVEKGSSDDIFYHPHHPYTWALMNSVPRLDLDNKKKLVTIEGSIPDMIHPPKGCAFCSRCPYAMNICAEYEPETVDAQDGSDKHQVACWLSDPRADRTGVPFQIGGAVHA